ncbi:hypothetical protein GJAV_G00234820 [Gymnothorax javanicus]|nr:hypothetical protein GJAV_G00234820 [Gymnothorax javanicus]
MSLCRETVPLEGICPDIMPRESVKAKPKTTPVVLKESTGRSRKRKADAAILLPDPDEEVAEMAKKRQHVTPASRSQAADCTCPCKRFPTPDKVEEADTWCGLALSQHNFRNVCTISAWSCTLPLVRWGDKDDVWSNLLKKDDEYTRDAHYLERHPQLEPKMRVILLDWLMQVCEVYKLHRETYHLAQDFFDRYMATQTGVHKTRLQLIGISALFIAAKMEEVYPPKVHEFAYVCDGVCTVDNILRMEMIIMQELKWRLGPMTSIAWLNLHMQMAHVKNPREPLMRQYPRAVFAQVAELLDVCLLDMKFLEFSNSMLAASALFHFSSLELVERVSGYRWSDLEECVKLMVPFAKSIREVGIRKPRTYKGIPPDDMHNIQVYGPHVDWLEKAYSYQLKDVERTQSSHTPSCALTPPDSGESLSLSPI